MSAAGPRGEDGPGGAAMVGTEPGVASRGGVGRCGAGRGGLPRPPGLRGATSPAGDVGARGAAAAEWLGMAAGRQLLGVTGGRKSVADMIYIHAPYIYIYQEIYDQQCQLFAFRDIALSQLLVGFGFCFCFLMK